MKTRPNYRSKTKAQTDYLKPAVIYWLLCIICCPKLFSSIIAIIFPSWVQIGSESVSSFPEHMLHKGQRWNSNLIWLLCSLHFPPPIPCPGTCWSRSPLASGFEAGPLEWRGHAHVRSPRRSSPVCPFIISRVVPLLLALHFGLSCEISFEQIVPKQNQTKSNWNKQRSPKTLMID